MGEPAHDLPTIEEELTRKALDQVQRLFEDYHAKKISKRELELCLTTVWACVSGLTRERFHDVISASSLELQAMPADEPELSVLLGGQQILLVHWRPGMEQVRMHVIPTAMKPTTHLFNHGDKLKPTFEASRTAHAIKGRALMKGMTALES